MKLYVLFVFLILSFQVFSAQTKQISRVLELEINSSINPATLNYLKSAAKQENDYDLFLLKLNTPGGLVTTTKEILNIFGNSKTPFMVWVTPEGASATSAGAIIASGAHILAMSEGTNIGAATPITMSGDIKGGKESKEEDDKGNEKTQSDARAKAINDLVALVKSLSQTRGRNPEGFAKMIKEAASFSAEDSLKNNLIDGILNKQSDLASFLNGKEITMQGDKFTLVATNIVTTTFDMDLGQKLLNILANPSLAYILLLLGAALLYLELQAPGGFIAGSLGAVCLVLAGIGMQILPLNFGALGLVALSFILFVLEIYITSYGILALGGVAALIAGSLFLYRTDNVYIHLSNSLIFSVVVAILSFMGFIAFVMIRDHKNIGKSKFNEVTNKKGVILSIVNEIDGLFTYQVKVNGEIWNATSSKRLENNSSVQLEENKDNKLTLIIK